MDINKATEVAYQNGYKAGSKETAEKFAEEVNSLLYERDCLREDIKRIARQLGAEIKE